MLRIVHIYIYISKYSIYTNMMHYTLVSISRNNSTRNLFKMKPQHKIIGVRFDIIVKLTITIFWLLQKRNRRTQNTNCNFLFYILIQYTWMCMQFSFFDKVPKCIFSRIIAEYIFPLLIEQRRNLTACRE